VEFKGEEWRGIRSGLRHEVQHVVRDEQEWKTFWEKDIAPFQNRVVDVPVIDFHNEMVLIVGRGEKPTASYDIQIVEIKKEATALLVRYKYIDRMVGMASPSYRVQPFHLKKLPAFNGPIQFELVKG
jgi:hypothetical protein